ncbi:MAG: hypothetical protein JO286_00480 [Solirubrobacterales bacterium]|nr:hypothetical protein [Solirubrobacterales bacterium]
MDGTRIGWPRRAVALASVFDADVPHLGTIVRSLMGLVWGLEPDPRTAPMVLVERAQGPAA